MAKENVSVYKLYLTGKKEIFTHCFLFASSKCFWKMLFYISELENLFAKLQTDDDKEKDEVTRSVEDDVCISSLLF